MTTVKGHHPVCKEICIALGLDLKYIKKLDLHMAYNEIVTVSIEYNPEEDGVKKLAPILKKFELVEVPICKDEEVIPIDEIKLFTLEPDEDKSKMDSYWLAEASYGGNAWYAKRIERNTVVGTTNAWDAMKFIDQEDCRGWIDSWGVPEIEKRRYVPVGHGFVYEEIKEELC